MGWLDEAKDAANQAKIKVTEVDARALIQKAKAGSSNAASNISNHSAKTINKTKKLAEDIDSQRLLSGTKKKVTSLTEESKIIAAESLKNSKHAIENINWEEITDGKHQKEKLIKYWQIGTKKLNEVARSTLEIDKNTMELVDDLQDRLPVPVQTVDGIFDQCRKVALQRATAVFFLNGAAESIDQDSSEKYANLSESYADFGNRIGKHNLRTSNENFSKMQDLRNEAKDSSSDLEDGYHKTSPLNPNTADIEHVIAAKEMYSSPLLKAGTTDQEMLNAINSEDNLIFTDLSVNRSKSDTPLSDFLERSEEHPTKEGISTITINGESHELSDADCELALEKATASHNHHASQAVMEMASTAAETSAVMALQQVVGMIVVETIDIFMGEVQYFTNNFELFDEKGFVGHVQELSERLSDKLSQRFEEKQIWLKARSLGIEAGVSGALSVITQILISSLTQLPAFILGMIREGTLSCIRSVRILTSNNANKFESISIIMASTASAVAGLYIGKVISVGVSSVPLLNQFNYQITSVLSELMVTATPLIAIYFFDQNKKKLAFALAK